MPPLTSSYLPSRISATLSPANRFFFLLAAACTLAPVVPAQSPQLTAVYTAMDAGAKRFQSATASVERDNFERVVKETTVDKGTMYIDRARGGIEFGATSPTQVVSFANGVLQLYTHTSAENQVDVFKAGANGGTLEGYLALGFGGTSQALTGAWTVSDLGPEALSDADQPVRCEKLLLVSKDPNVRSNTFKQITLWLDPVRDVSLKQLFETPSGDTQTVIYSNIKLNAKPNKAAYKIPTGKGVTVVNH